MRATPRTSKGIKAGEGRESHPGTTFLPLLRLLPVVLFLVTSFSWQRDVEGRRGRDQQEKPCYAGDTSRKTMWSAEAGNGLEARVGVAKIGGGVGCGEAGAAVTTYPGVSRPGTTVSGTALPTFLCHPRLGIPATAPNSRLGEGRVGNWGAGVGGSPQPLTPGGFGDHFPGSKAGRDGMGWAGGGAEPSLDPLAPRPPALSSPGAGVGEVPARVSYFPRPERTAARRLSAARKRAWGDCKVGCRGTAAGQDGAEAASFWQKGGERESGGRRSHVRDWRGPRCCYVEECKNVSNFGDPDRDGAGKASAFS